jgi:hypothetical protein
MNKEKLKHHIVNLKVRHQELETKIKESFDHYDSDEKVKELKIKKLQVKKEIEWLESEMAK